MSRRTGGNFDTSVAPATHAPARPFDLEHHRRVRQLVFLQPARMQFADPRPPRNRRFHARAASRMQRRMLGLHEARDGGREQRLEIALDVEEVDRARRDAPLLVERRAVGERTTRIGWR
jgi:hypothetical protein